ncbi:type II secretion system F family protein [Pseudalkalibacillus berkeleyi]|uniref:Type II secretion system F family protein n=1 Tax=Pseudalkalibacillus berkeleyi TaxID=1069813 RepID=A0ABS9H043_9BACL|nr:type II secretion system F family protein [Pseudalkalibacillus berkeleyi]MCF6137286.1 type II secretion system F family protein [Pseudalkalibacillus berkeleyi]
MNKNKQMKDEKPKTMYRKMLHIIGNRFEGNSYVRKWLSKLEVSALPYTPEEFFALRILMGLTLPIILFFLNYNWSIIVGGVLVGYFIPVVYLNWKKKNRLNRCSEQLSQALGTMANALRAGFSFIQAMELVAKEMPDPIGSEFSRTLRDIKFGISTDVALKNLVTRLPDRDLDLVVNALIIQRSTGGNLAALLETMQETIFGRFRVKEELKSLTAQGKMSSWVVTLLPLSIALYLNTVNPDYFRPLLEHPVGWVMLGAGTLSCLIGWFLIRKIVHVEV